MKKAITLLFIFALTLLTSCGSSKEKDPAVKYALGTYTESGYESENLGYQFISPQGCTLATREELATLMGMDEKYFKKEYVKKKLTSDTQLGVIDIKATMDSGAYVTVIWANSGRSLADEAAVAEYVKQTKLEMTTTKALPLSFNQDYERVEIAGREYIKITCENYANMEYTLWQEYYIYTEPDYSITITFTYPDREKVDKEALLGAFSEL